ncbi:hypothetical protein LBMAG42_54020 [Deltaproteobacteria bacterium]|nr:hypothetical protein LBMAG42_54020 [Deltaproteobacteria bacterium]
MSTIRRQITIEASPRTIWAALTTVEGLKSWLADDASLIPIATGRFSVTMEGDEAPITETGRFHTIRPTSKLEIHFDKTSGGPWKGTALTFTIAREGSQTVVNILHTGSGFDDAAVFKDVDDTWRRALIGLRDGLEGT